mgnify:CR=1 FL=1
MSLDKKHLRRIIKDELTKTLQEADLPPDYFTKKKFTGPSKGAPVVEPPGGWKKKPFVPDFTKKSDMPDFRKRKPQFSDDPIVRTLKEKFGIGDESIKIGVPKIVEIYYRLRSKSMPRENPEYGKLPWHFENPEYPIEADEEFLELVSKMPSASRYGISELPWPYEEIDVHEDEWKNKIYHMGHKTTNDVDLMGDEGGEKVAYLWPTDEGIIKIVFFGR